MTNIEKLNELYPHTLRCAVQDCPECAEYLALSKVVGQEMQDAVRTRGEDLVSEALAKRRN